MRNRTIGRQLLIAGLALLLTACGSEPVYQEEAFSAQSPYQRQIRVELEQACEGARLALLSQGYVIDATDPRHIKGLKVFQPDPDEHATIEFQVVCALHQGWATLYATATENRYELKKTSDSAGVSIPSVGSISLPFGSSTHSLVKVAGETITDESFYKRFFDLVERQIGLAPSGSGDSGASSKDEPVEDVW